MSGPVAETLFQFLTGFFAHYGYWAIFFGVMLENAGLPVGGGSVLILAGFRAYRGGLRLDRAMGTAVLGATIGDSRGYCLGGLGGAAFVKKYPRRLPFFARQFARAEALFLRHGHLAVFFGRFITGLRIFVGILAGMFRMRYLSFLFFNFTGAVSWATTFGCVGFAFGSSWAELAHFVREFHRLTLAAVAAAVFVSAIVYLWRRRSGT